MKYYMHPGSGDYPRVNSLATVFLSNRWSEPGWTSIPGITAEALIEMYAEKLAGKLSALLADESRSNYERVRSMFDIFRKIGVASSTVHGNICVVYEERQISTLDEL